MCKYSLYIAKKTNYDIYSFMNTEIEDAQNILNWYLLAGVDAVCDEQPHNFLSAYTNISSEEKTETIQKNLQTPFRPATSLLAQESSTANLRARELCNQAQTLDDLRAMVENFDGCALKFSANSTVFGYGNPNAELMIIGEAPGADEDRIGEPFVGRSGHLLDKMLQAIHLQRQDCYITNILPWRPPGNRTPTDAEVAVCLPFLQRQIELIKPNVILLLGASAANAILDNNYSISQLRGHFMEYALHNDFKIQTLATFHPAYLLRSPAQKAKAWQDFLRLKIQLEKM